MSLCRSLCLIGCSLSIASTVHAAAFVDAVLAQNPALYYQFESAGGSVLNTAPNNIGVNLGTTPITGRSYNFTSPGAGVTAVFGNASTLRPSGGFLGMTSGNNAATFTSSTIASNLDVDSAGNGTTHKTNYKAGTAGATAMTFSAWVNPVGLDATSQTLMAGTIGSTNSAAAAFQFNLVPTGFELGGRSKTGDSSFTSAIIPYPVSFTVDEWHHVVGIMDYATKTVTVYVDGVSAGTSAPITNTWTTPLTYGSATTGGVVTVGALYNSLNTDGTGRGGSANSKQFLGQIDEVAIFNRALTPQQIAGLYTAALPEPASLAALAAGGVMLGRRRRG